MSNKTTILSWLGLAAALFLLNLAPSFESLWPTPGIRWAGQVSVELGLLLIVMAAGHRLGAGRSRVALGLLAALWTALAFGRYAAVTSAALFGREINLYWDSQHLSAVVAMLTQVMSPLLVLAVTVATVLVPLAVYAALRWAVGQVSRGMDTALARRGMGWLGAAIVAVFAVQRAFPDAVAFPVMPPPVAQTFARQAWLVTDVLTGRSADTLGEGPALRTTLAAVHGADILLVFTESYGAVTFDRPSFAAALRESREQFARDIQASGRSVVSAFVESPTFGGSSWLAHVSLMTGFEVRDEGANVRLMAQKRDTLVSTLAGLGYRTVAIMPGLQRKWPEGGFYGFDEIYSTERLAYHGPSFGWWPIPDQFALAQLDALELGRPQRPPVFAFMPTTSTHAPFGPTPPYQPDWPRMLTTEPYDQADYDRAWAEPPDWLNLGPGYVNSVKYAYASLGGFFGRPHDRDFVMVMLGDHQPAAAVSGEGARWDVPVHVIASRPEILDVLRTRGFTDGVTPAQPTLMRMHELLPVLLDAFGGSAPPPVLSAATRAETARR